MRKPFMSANTTLNQEALIETAQTTKINVKQVIAALDLMITQDCTVPFVTRYRKEVTGGLDEEQLRAIADHYEQVIEREKRRDYIMSTLEKMEVLTPELKKSILAATSQNVLEDIYAPYKSKKKTKGQLAADAGLTPLSEQVLSGSISLEKLSELEQQKWLNPDKKIVTFDDALKGISSILIEKFSHHLPTKETLRSDYWQQANLKASKRKDAETIKDWQKYSDYFEFEQPIRNLKDPKTAHRFLALRRAMGLKILKVDVEYSSEQAVGLIKKNQFIDQKENLDFLMTVALKAFNTAIHPSLDLEVKTELKKSSDEAAIDVFGVNLKNLLLQPYLGAKSVIALDPGVRTGCKTVVIDDTGKLLYDCVIYPHQPKNDIEGSKIIIDRLVEHFKVGHIAVGDGTFGRETLAFLQEHIEAIKSGSVMATLVNESGASIYSASEIAKKEFPDKDATVRGAVSIARRFQDPLAELVKIDPKSIGVGQYQHDVNQSRLKKTLGGVVEDCVNFVGVDINTASAPLLSFVSGIGPTVATNIVQAREKNGPFKERKQLLEVSRYSDKIFTQSAGFLKIYNGINPLDTTSIHPERYDVLKTWAKSNQTTLSELVSNPEIISKLEKDQSFIDNVGTFTHQDIIKSLKAPGQDPRTEFKSTEFRKGISKASDLVENEWYTGVVTNITQFGAFVNIGIKTNGLVHISQMADRFVSNALEVLKVGQEVKARVVSVDLERDRIALSLKSGDQAEKTQVKNQIKTNRSANSSSTYAKEVVAPKNNAFAALKNFKVK